MADSIYWHDYEAFGADPRRDRAVQFAGIRTDLQLNEIDEPLVTYCQPAPDYLPHPAACLITGITPQIARERGVPEAEFVRRIHEQFSQPGTCGAGYNSIRFDDELSRQLLYRNFHDPYEREWKNGNSRWDIIDMLRLCQAVRPEGINWPRKDDGAPSFRLEELSVANGIEHTDAHDALADVRATIAMARLVREQHPKLYRYVFDLRNKRRVQQLVDIKTQKPCLHISAMYPAEHGKLALIMPLGMHPLDQNGILVYDLRNDPDQWLDSSIESLREALFKPAAERTGDEPRLPVKVLHINRCPVVVSPGVLSEIQLANYKIDLARCHKNWQRLKERHDFSQRLAQVFNERPQRDEPPDPDNMLYSGGFFGHRDKALMQEVRSLAANELVAQYASLCQRFQDKRLPEMLFRYLARSFPSSINTDMQQRWKSFCRQRLLEGRALPDSQLTLEKFDQAILDARKGAVHERNHEVLDALKEWMADIEAWLVDGNGI